MKHAKIKLLALFGVLCLSLNATNVNAASLNERETTVQISEFEVYAELKALSEEELVAIGLSKEEVSYIKNFDLVREVRERASLSDEQLLGLGYTVEDILSIRSLSNRRSVTEADVMNEARGATLTLTLTNVSTSRTCYMYYFSFEWSSCPIFRAEDVIAIMWAGCNDDGIAITLAIDEPSSYMMIRYVTIAQNTHIETKAFEWYPVNEYSSVKVNFDVDQGIMDSFYTWASNGYGVLVLDVVGNASIYEVYCRIGYGHLTAVGSASVSFSGSGPSISMSFNGLTNEEDLISVRYRYNGTKIGW